MANKWKLIKEIAQPGKTITAGTPGNHIGQGDYCFDMNNVGRSTYSEEYMRKYPDFFEEVQEPKWTDKDMTAFADFYNNTHHSLDKALEAFKKENGYE